LASVALLAILLGGCDSFGHKPPPPPTDPNVYPTRYRAEVTELLRTYLNNPRKLRDPQISEPALRPVSGVQHYVSCVRYTARGAGGAYTEQGSKVAIFLGGRLTQFLEASPELCGGALYQRFPEAEAIVP
jgi:hypothetical protein